MFGFLNIGIADILDIILVALIIFYAFRMLRGSQAMSIFIGIVMLYALRVVCAALNMKMMSSMLGAFLDVGLIALIVIFQPEIRRFMISFGNRYRNSGARKWFSGVLAKEAAYESTGTINEICKACEAMSEQKCGALIVIQKGDQLAYIAETGDMIDAKVSQRLLRNLFFKNSPLHDGAVIIAGDRIVAARGTLPITDRTLPASFGMRHKAAVGMSETSDAIVVVVSEETGKISVAHNGKIEVMENINDLKRALQNS